MHFAYYGRNTELFRTPHPSSKDTLRRHIEDNCDCLLPALSVMARSEYSYHFERYASSYKASRVSCCQEKIGESRRTGK
jgi:hypothetical protein